VSDEIDLRVDRSLELLGQLRQTAAQFTQREEQLAKELKTRRYGTERQTRQAIADADASHAAHVSSSEQYFQGHHDRLVSTYEGRRNRVQEYCASHLKFLPKRTQEVKEGWIGKLQMKNYQEQRKLTGDMADSDAAYTGFISELENLKELEKHARHSFAGYGSLKRRLRAKPSTTVPTDAQLAAQLDEARQRLNAMRTHLDEFDQFFLPRFFRFAPLPALFVLFAAIGGGVSWYVGFNPTGYMVGGGVGGVLFLVFVMIHAIGQARFRPAAAQAAAEFAAARQLFEVNGVASPDFVARRDESRRLVKEEYDRGYADILQQWGRADEVAADFERRTRTKLEVQTRRISEKIDRLLQPKLDYIAAQRAAHLDSLNQDASVKREQLVEIQTTQLAALEEEEKTRWNEIETDWHREITPLYQAIEQMHAEGERIAPPWNPLSAENWVPPTDFGHAGKFGSIDVDLAQQPGILPQNPRLVLPGPTALSLPAALAFPYQGSLIFETSDSGEADVFSTLNNIILRLLYTNPPGKLTFTIIDPVRLGQNFAGLMHLGDYQESLINRRIWTQGDQIEERLAEMSEHIEKVIQMYLRDEYATITEYNLQAGKVAEKYYFLVIADFPAGFSETAIKRLQSIASSGPRCGIFTLIHWDQRQPSPGGFAPEEFRKNSVCISRGKNDFNLGEAQLEMGATLTLDPPPDAELGLALVHKIGKLSVDSNRVEVPFIQIAPKPEELWTNETSSELRVAIGRTGATKLQYMAIGKGTRQHALFAGKTGSGKSTLFHVIITNLALACSPDEVEFYLIDFKKGVEFKCYASRHLPHAKVIAIESDREFALSVLQRIDGELRRRGDLFRKVGVQDVAGYKKATGLPMPRTLLIIDEFQEFFVEDDTIAQSASLLFDRIVRQGRAFGIHVLLGSQTLGGAYSLARATLGQMSIRVALQCNEADAYLIMDENNSAPRLLSRPGEGIYNDAAGAMEGNSPFQVVWLPDEERDEWLDKIEHLAAANPEKHYSTPIVFEGNAPADIRENDLLRTALDTVPTARPVIGRIWLGAPNSIKGPTEAAFQRQSGNHLLIVGQREEAALTMLGVSILALAAQYPKGDARIILFQSAPPGTPEADYFANVLKAVPFPVSSVQANGIPAIMEELSAELQTRAASEANIHDFPPMFLFIHGLHKFKKLKHADDFSFSGSSDDGPDPGAMFDKLISEGSSLGIHIITTIDTLNSVNNFMSRKALSEFEMRVVFQMSANDSASLIDSPKAANLGLHRAFFYNEHEGYLETFRPYAMPETTWVEQVGEKLAQR